MELGKKSVEEGAVVVFLLGVARFAYGVGVDVPDSAAGVDEQETRLVLEEELLRSFPPPFLTSTGCEDWGACATATVAA